jgi:hypothetical protein
LEMRDNLFVLLARLEGFGPPTCGLEVRCSIQLSYRRVCAFSVSDKDETEFRISKGGLKRIFLETP